MFGNGHINDTYRIVNLDFSKPDYLLQRINSNVFPNVSQLMENLGKVSDYILQQEGCQQLVPTLIPTQNDELFVDLESGFWRVFEFVDGSGSLDRPENSDQAYQAALGYGKFLSALDQFPVQNLHVTIPDFHNMKFRLRQFNEALKITSLKKKSRQYTYH